MRSIPFSLLFFISNALAHGRLGPSRSARTPRVTSPGLSSIVLPKLEPTSTTSSAAVLPIAGPVAAPASHETPSKLTLADPAVTVEPTTKISEMIAFGIPVSALFLSNFALGAVDTAATGRFGGIRDLAALAPGTSAMEYSCYVLSAMATITLNRLAPVQPGSAEWHERLRASVTLAAVAALLQATLTFVFASSLASFVGCPAEVLDRSASYLRWRVPGIPFFHLGAACSSAFFAAKDSVRPFVGTLVAVAINIAGDLLLCPRYGLVGAAAATSLSQLVLAAFLFSRLRSKGLSPPRLFRRPAPPQQLLRVVRLVAPVSMLTLMRTSLYAALGVWCCQMGLLASAAQQIATTFFWGATNAAGEPMSAAAQTFLPSRVEAWREAARHADEVGTASAEVRVFGARAALLETLRRLFATCALFGAVVGAVVFRLTTPGPLAIITSNAAAIAQVPRLPLVAIAVVCPLALLCEGALLSFGARAALVKNLAGCVTLCFLTGGTLMRSGVGSVPALWWVAALFQLTRFLSNGAVLRRKLRAPPA